ncbi:hypothetical protein DFH09DRAFT_1093189 [Mycena vulgaris]|nr:hypothetical protein DFH09DRAFT_1093189 [Mycena vulgaris]
MQSSPCLQFTSRVVPSKPIATKAKALAQASQRTSKVPDRPDDRVAHAFNGHEERGTRRSVQHRSVPWATSQVAQIARESRTDSASPKPSTHDLVDIVKGLAEHRDSRSVSPSASLRSSSPSAGDRQALSLRKQARRGQILGICQPVPGAVHEEHDLLEKICIKIHNRGRFRAGVQPLSRMPNASSLGIAAFQAAMKEYEQDEQTETDGENGYPSEVEPTSAAAPVPAPSAAM